MQTGAFGEINPHVVGIVMKELMRRAIDAADRHLLEFEIHEKASLSGGEDFFTTVDTALQQIYVKSLRECFPHVGIVAEETDLRVESALGYADCYFAVDPVDGTKALVRRQSHGIGTMIAFVWRGEVVGVILPPNLEKPWDVLPIIGISQKLGFELIELPRRWPHRRPWLPPITDQIYNRGFELLVVHHTRLNEV